MSDSTASTGNDPAKLQQAFEERIRASVQRFQAFLDHGPILASIKDETLRYVYANKPLAHAFGTTSERIQGLKDFDLFPDRVADVQRQNDRTVLRTGRSQEQDETIALPDGSLRHWRITRFLFVEPSGQKYVGSIIIDITDQKRIQQTLVSTFEAIKSSEDRFRAALDASLDSFAIWQCVRNPSGEIIDFICVDLNRRAECLMRMPREAAIGKRLLELFPQTRTPGFFDRYVRVVETREASEHEFPVMTPGFTAIWLRQQIIPLKDGIALTSWDISERKKLEHEIQEQLRTIRETNAKLEEANTHLQAMAALDGLTGLKNRRAFQEFLDVEFARRARYNDDEPISLLILDIDHFKPYNDSYGHPAGDGVLERIAQILQENSRATDFVARYGGEEFVIVMPNTDYAGSLICAERYRTAILEAYWTDRSITASLGLATTTVELVDGAELVSRADRALYASKHRGRNRTTHYTDLRF